MCVRVVTSETTHDLINIPLGIQMWRMVWSVYGKSLRSEILEALGTGEVC